MIAFITVNDDQTEEHHTHALKKSLILYYQQFTPYLESYSPREFFLDLGREEAAWPIVNEIWEGLIPAYGQKATVALAPSKLLSRAISLPETREAQLPELIIEEKTQGTLIFLPAHKEAAVRRRLPLEVLWPLELRLRQHLLKLGFQTWGEIAGLSPEKLKIHLGEDAYFAWDLANGRWTGSLTLPQEGIQIPVYREEESTDLIPALEKAAETLAQTLQTKWLGCRELTLAGTSREGTPFAQKRLFPEPCSSRTCIAGETFRLWQKLSLTAPPKQIHLRADGLEPMAAKQLSLFNNSLPSKAKEEQLTWLLARLRKDYPASFLDRASNWRKSRREQILAFYDPWRFRREANE